MLLGGVLALITIVCLEEQKQSDIKTITAVRKNWGFNLLGIIPAVEKKTKILSPSVSENIVGDFSNSPNFEAYLMLQQNLSSIISERNLNAIVVTSAIGKEGKSTVSANLAVAMAQLGRKVLLVDANLRHPQQHHLWNLPNHFGLSELLFEAESQPRVTNIKNNLDVITSGVVPPNPAALFSSPAMASSVEQFTNNYDLVIFDTPSLDEAVDACILGHMADGILLVAGVKTFDPNTANFAKELLMQFGQNVIGIVVNQAQSQRRQLVGKINPL